MRTCPACGLISPQSATRCDCGASFQSVSRGELDKIRRGQLEKPLQRRALGVGLMVFGAIPVVVALISGAGYAVFGLVNAPFLVGLGVAIHAHLRVLRLRALEVELPQAKATMRDGDSR